MDYNINDKWKIFGRMARYNTTDIAGNPTPNKSALYVPTGTARAAWNAGGDAIWTINARTVVDFHGDWHSLLDAYVSTRCLRADGARSGRTINWYAPYQTASVGRRSIFRT